MSQTTYVAFTDRMIQRYEGGYGWNKADPGGPTKYGITCHDLAEQRGQKMDSMARWAPIVQAMTLAEAEAIYAKKYAAGIRYSDLPPGPDACMEDYGVNSGVSRPILVARHIVGLAGSGMNQALVDSIRKYDPNKFIDQMCDERLAFMHAIRGGSAWAEFGGGWGSRVADLRSYTHHLVTATPATAPEAPDMTHVAMPKATNVAKTAGKVTTGGAISSGAVIEAAGMSHWVAGGIVIGIFAAGIVYEAWQDYKTNAANTTVHLPLAA
jgi:lysozyme family protein